MKKFKEYLKEEWYQTYKIPSLKDPLNIFKNPSRKEIMELAKQDFDSFRVLLMDNGDVYAWSKAIHAQAHKALKLNDKFIPAYIEFAGNTGVITITDFINKSYWGDHREMVAEQVRTNKHLKKLFNNIKIGYYNKRSTGDWEQ